MTLPRRNSEAEFEAFCIVCDRLGGFDHRTTPEWADGYFTALAVFERGLALEDAVVRMAGDAFERTFADPEDRANALRSLRARVAVLHDQLDADALFEAPDELRLSPLMIAWTDEDRDELRRKGEADEDEIAGLVTGAEWAAGFLDALTDAGEAWAAGVADEEIEYAKALLGQVGALELAEGSEALREHVAATFGSEGADRDRLIDAACFAVQDLWLWRVDHAPRPETRRVEKTPGRNDPCPCGSGKKYKKCHGA